MTKLTTVDEYIAKNPTWQNHLTALRQAALGAGFEEGIKWGAPIYMLDGKNLVGLAAFKSYVGLWFHQGALLSDTSGVLINASEGKTKALRQWRFASDDAIPMETLKTYLAETIENHQKGNVVQASPQAWSLPSVLQTALEQDSELSVQFSALTPGKQKEYALHISSAKREATQISRLEKAIPLIKEGKGLNDKYRC